MKEGTKILIVQDDMLILRAQARLLEEAGYLVTTATDGQEGLRLARAIQPDLILLETMLRNGDGFEICRRIKADPMLGQAFVVLVSGAEKGSDEQARGLEAGADGTIVRPIGDRELLAHLEALLRIRRAEEELRASEARYRDVFENAPIGIYRTTPQGEILMANPTLVQMLGYNSFEELAQRDLESEGYHPYYPRSEFRRRIEEQGQVRGLEAAWRRKGGSTLYVRENARAVTDELGHLCCYQGTVEDVTEHVQRMQRLERLNTILDAIGDANRTVFREEDRGLLINGVCERLVAARGYGSAWIVLLGEAGELRQAAATGLGGDFTTIVDGLKEGQADPSCAEVLSRPGVWVKYARADCPLARVYVNEQPMAIRLEHAGVIHGLMMVSLPAGVEIDETEKALFEELAGNVAFALHSIGLQEEQRRADLALQASEKRYRVLFESTGTATCVFGDDGIIRLCNRTFEALAGLPKETIEGQMRWSDFVAEEDLERMQRYHAQRSLGTGDPPTEYAFTFVTAQGESRDIYLHIDLVTGTGERVASLTDVTRLKEAEYALRESAERYRTLFESAPEAITLLSLEGTVLDCNSAAEEIAGLPRERIIGRPFTELQALDVDDLPQYRALFSRLLSGQCEEPLELRVQRKDGQTRWVEAFPVPIIKRGEVHAIQVIARDISEQKRAEASLHRSLDEAAHSQRLLLALSQAAQAVQRARSPQAVYRAIGEQLTGLEFDAAIFTLTEDRTHLRPSHLAIRSNLVRLTERLTGLPSEGYRFPLPLGGFFQRIIAKGETVFSELDTVPFAEAMHPPVQLLVRRLARSLAWQQAIYAPLTIGGEVQGLLAIAGADLTKSDVSAITAFANQAAIAIENARLYRETQQLAAFNESIVQNMAEGIVMENADGVLTFVNPAAATMLNYDPHELVGLHWTDIVPPDQQPLVERANERRVEGEADRYELELMRRNGERLPVFTAGTPRLDGSGRLIGTMAVFTDIAKLKEAERALRESEERFRQVYENMAVGVARVSTGSLIEGANEAYCRMLGYREEELVGKHLRDITHPETVEENLRKQAQLAVGEIDHYRMEKRFIHRDGHVIHGIVDANLVRDAEGEPLYALGSVLDITERKRMVEQLRQQERLAAVGQLAGGIAHDFNNILAAIILYAQMPLRRSDLPPALQGPLQTILTESRRAADLIQQILDFSRSAMMRTEPLSLVAVVTETLALLRRTIPEHIRLVTEVTSHPCTVQADATRIQQVLMNLALNAKDAMPRGGTLRIAVAPVIVALEDEPSLPALPPGAWACLTVSDTGIGMTEEVQAHLFEPFFTTKEAGKGTGLGLAQVYGIVKQHQGYIDVDTAVGEGTTFTIFLPLVEERQRETGATSGLPALRGRGETILVVEDAQRLRDAIRAGLEHLEYRVIPAANGREALQAVSSHDIDLVLSDLVMPEMGGKALLRSLRGKDPRLKVVAITGHVMDTDLKGLRAAGFADAVSKPLSIEDLSRVVRRALDETP